MAPLCCTSPGKWHLPHQVGSTGDWRLLQTTRDSTGSTNCSAHQPLQGTRHSLSRWGWFLDRVMFNERAVLALIIVPW